MSKKPVGLVIKSLINDKNLSADQMAKLTGKSRQQVYNDFNRVGMKDDEIERYANALQIDKKVIYDRLEGGDMPEPDSASYLMEHLANLEEQFKRLLNQMDVKDRQIEGLQKTVEVLLGKSNPAPVMSKEMPLWDDIKQAMA